MKKIILFSPLLLMTLLMSSCAAIEEVVDSFSVKTQKGDYQKMNFTPKGVYQFPQVADLDIAQQRVKLSFTYENAMGEEARKLAKGDFIKQQKCDVVVEPLLYITTTTTESGTTSSVTISGYPANYRNVRNYQLADSVFFKHYSNMPW